MIAPTTCRHRKKHSSNLLQLCFIFPKHFNSYRTCHCSFFCTEVIFLVAFDFWCCMALNGHSGSAHTKKSAAVKQAFHEPGYTEPSCFSAFCLAQVQGWHTLADKALALFIVWSQMAAYSHKVFCNSPSALPQRGSSAPPRHNLLQHRAYWKYSEVSAAKVLLNTTQVVFTLSADFKQYII